MRPRVLARHRRARSVRNDCEAADRNLTPDAARAPVAPGRIPRFLVEIQMLRRHTVRQSVFGARLLLPRVPAQGKLKLRFRVKGSYSSTLGSPPARRPA